MVLMSAIAIVPSVAVKTPSPKLRVAVAIVPPFAMQQKDKLTGVSVDLSSVTATRLSVKSGYALHIRGLAEQSPAQKDQLCVTETSGGWFVSAALR